MEGRKAADDFQHLLATVAGVDLFYAQLLQKELQTSSLDQLKDNTGKRIFDMGQEDLLSITEDREAIESEMTKHW